MAAGLGFKTFTTGEVLTAADTNGYLMQGILVFASEAARNSAITSPQEGQFAFTKDNNSTWYYDGAAWVASGASGDVTGVTAGTGITVTNPTGPVPTVTNDMATTITASGDIVVGTGSGTYDNLPIGTTGQILTADTTVSPYKVKWATASSGSYTLLTSGTLSGANVSLTSISQSYQDLQLIMTDVVPQTSGEGIVLEINGGGNNYFYATVNANGTWTTTNNTNILATSGQSTSQQYMTMNISNYTSTAASAFSTWGWTRDTNNYKRNYIGMIRATAAITSIQMKVQDATNYTSGNYYLYGIK